MVPVNGELRRELLAMAEEDQQVRYLADERAGPDGDIPDDLAREWTRVDEANTACLAEIVAAHGWPTRSLVGDDGANAAWLLAQHADGTPACNSGSSTWCALPWPWARRARWTWRT